MRAARLSAWRAPLEVGDAPDSAPPPGGVVLRVLACGICRSDWHVRTGADPDVTLPQTPGHEFCGEVVAVGPGVTRWRAGDRAALTPGEWLAVWGAGGVGLSALILARAMGARVVMVDVVTGKLAHARAQGAEAVVNAAEGDPVAAVREITGGGAHVALGVVETTANALRSLRKLGRMVQVAMPAGAHATMTLPWDAVCSGQLAVYGARGMPGHRFPALFSLIAARGVDLSPLIARRVALSDVTADLARFDGPAPPGVAVITDFAA
ncbi:MAG: alcohol dehydrogenase [Rhodobacteraceae bacterium HLUCCA09]|nr:MAG: alcohol dehydrogenase [Rhodobacteraceae bacterium HLUCCA09]